MHLEHGTEPVVGWRVWNVSDGAEGPTLWPATKDTDPWPRRRPFEARCAASRLLTRRHEAPDVDCVCGVYAGSTLGFVTRSRPAWPPAPVIGRASLWGRTIAHEQGWRAKYAYPDRLRLVCVVCAWIAPGPGEPIVVHGFRRRLYPLCDEHAGGLELPDGRRTRRVDTGPQELLHGLLDAYAVDILPAEPIAELIGRPAAAAVPPYIPSIRLIPR